MAKDWLWYSHNERSTPNLYHAMRVLYRLTELEIEGLPKPITRSQMFVNDGVIAGRGCAFRDMEGLYKKWLTKPEAKWATQSRRHMINQIAMNCALLHYNMLSELPVGFNVPPVPTRLSIVNDGGVDTPTRMFESRIDKSMKVARIVHFFGKYKEEGDSIQSFYRKEYDKFKEKHGF